MLREMCIRDRGETLYALRCIPIGGYCAMEGEDGDSDNPRAFGNAKLWKRLIILVAGSFMNFVAGVLIAVLFVSIRFDVLPGTTFGTFAEGCPYESESAFQVGDTTVSYTHLFLCRACFPEKGNCPAACRGGAALVRGAGRAVSGAGAL